MARLNYVELPASDIRAAKTFYEQAFGWTLAEFGPTYAATVTEASRAPLAVIDVPDLEAALKSVVDAGGTIVRPIFEFPGGRRFQFLDPNGNELAAGEADHP